MEKNLLENLKNSEKKKEMKSLTTMNQQQPFIITSVSFFSTSFYKNNQ